jgi:hypothetical protein
LPSRLHPLIGIRTDGGRSALIFYIGGEKSAVLWGKRRYLSAKSGDFRRFSMVFDGFFTAPSRSVAARAGWPFGRQK